MHNIKSNFDIIFQTIKSLELNDFGADGNVIRTGPKPKLSDLEVISLTLTSEYMSIDSENLLFKKLNSCHRQDFPQLIDRSQFNRRKKDLFHYIGKIRAALAQHFVASEQYFIVDSMPIEICKLSREKRARICKETLQTAPDKGYCASQQMYFYGYKLHGVCSVNGVFHSIDLTKASVHDNEILKDLNTQLSDCVLLGDKGYIGKQIQLDLFQTASIRLHSPMRSNQKHFKPYPGIFRRTRKRLETLFSQLCDQFMIRRNYAKTFKGFRTRILAKITALTIVQFINYFILNRPINNIKHAIF
ncbi:MAG: IS982 family transposase [Bacteroidetes bacterium]|nr:IS982 family transposase [Bacteroidota bacterium]